MGKTVYEWFTYIFSGGIFQGVIDILAVNPQTKYPTAWAGMKTVYTNVALPLGVGLMFVWFCMAFVKKCANENVTFEQIFLLTVKMVAAKYVMDHGLDIMCILWSGGIALVNSMGLTIQQIAAQGTAEAWKTFSGKDVGDYPNMLTSIGLMFQLLVPYIIAYLCELIVKVFCYARLLELYVRTALAPIALSDFMAEGSHGTGMRFLKNYLAVCLQGVCIVAAVTFCSNISGDIIAHNSNVLFMSLINLSCVAIVAKSQSIVKELVGTN